MRNVGQSSCNRLIGTLLFAIAMVGLLEVSGFSQGVDSFNPGAPGSYATSVDGFAIEPDNKILVSGSFLVLGGQLCTGFGRLTEAGTMDLVLSSSSASVGPVAIRPDGKIDVAGSFTTVDGQTITRFGRLNANGTMDKSVNPGFDGAVMAMALQPDGKVVVGGTFTHVSGQNRSYIARLNADGTLDAGFNPGITAQTGYLPMVFALAVQTNGNILVGGSFSRLAGFSRQYFGRITSGGTFDSSFTATVNNPVESIAIQPDGKILVGGYFTVLNGVAWTNLARLNANGTLDTSFNYGASSDVFSIALQTDGKILAGGRFSRIGGAARNGLARLNPDGTADTAFTATVSSIGSFSGAGVNGVALQSDGKVLVGGSFQYLAGQLRTNIGRLNATDPATQTLTYDGATITWARTGTAPEVWRTVFDVCTNGLDWYPLGAGTRVSGGWQVPYAGLAPNATVRARGCAIGGYYNSYSWFVESSFGPPVLENQPASATNNAGSAVRLLATAAGSPPLVYQWFKDGEPLSDTGSVSGSGSDSLTVSNVVSADAGGYTLVVTNDSGSVTSVIAQVTILDPYILSEPTNLWAALGQSAVFNVAAGGSSPLTYQWRKDGATLPGATSNSLALTNIQSADFGIYDVLVTMGTTTLTSAPASLGILDTLTQGITPPTGFSPVSFLTPQPDGKILVGGSFTAIGGQTRSNIARLNPDGSLDPGFNPGTDNYVNAAVVQSDGKIVVGGSFTNLAGTQHSNIGRLNPDGTPDVGFNPAADFKIIGLGLQQDGALLLGGSFSTLNGQPRNYIGRLNPDGTLDTTFNPGANNAVEFFLVQPDAKIVIAGPFTTLAGQPRSYLGRLNPNGSIDSGFNPGVTGSAVYCAALQSDSKIVVGGNFVGLGGQSRASIGRLNPDGSVDLTFNPGANGWVYSLAVQTDGKILVAGSFTTLAGQACKYLGRLNSDGSLDGAFTPTPNATLNCVSLQRDGAILLAGNFSMLAGQACSQIGRLGNTALTSENLGFDASSVVWTRAGPGPELSAATIDLSTNGTDWFDLGPAARMQGGWGLSGISVPANGTVRGRGFVPVGGLGYSSQWSLESFAGPPAFETVPAAQTDAAGSTVTLAVHAGGTQPLSYQWLKGGVPVQDGGNISGAQTPSLTLSQVLEADAADYSVAVCNAYGCRTELVATVTIVDPYVTSPPLSQWGNRGESVRMGVNVAGTEPLFYQWRKNGISLAGATGSALVLDHLQSSDAGSYDVVITNRCGSATSAAAVLSVNMAPVDSLNPEPSGHINALVVQPNGQILMGGNFTNLEGSAISYISRLNPDGTVDDSFNPNPGYRVTIIGIQPDKNILVGDVYQLAGQSCKDLGRVKPDGTIDTNFTSAFASQLLTMALQPDGKIVMDGIARLNTDGSIDPSFTVSANANVWCTAVQPDGKIVVGGDFYRVNGSPCTNIARLYPDGTLDTNFQATGSGTVYALAVQPDGRILVGGYFTLLDGVTNKCFGRLNPDGTLDASFKGWANSTVAAITLQADGDILVGGWFTSLSGQPRPYLGRLLPDGTADSTFNPGADQSVYALTIQPDGSILVGGYFTSLGGHARSNFGKLASSSPASQSFALTGDSLEWFRGGSSPEVWRVTFECSTNATDWVWLGAGARIAGGWQLNSISVPAGATVRARGFVSTPAYFGASHWFVEVLWPAAPVILVNDGAFGLGPDGFGFNVGGAAGWSVVIESSPDLSTWTPVATNILGAGPVHFVDASWLDAPKRFYRARAQLP